MITIVIIITTTYTILIALFIIGFDKVKPFKTEDSKPKNTFTIIIPFRNEAANLLSHLDSLSKLEYPKELFEVILVNDDSNDNSVEIIEQFKIENSEIIIYILDNFLKSNSPKKDALETAIENSKFDWIITTDADCIVPTKWLEIFDEFIQKNNSKMICAPVTFSVKNSFLEQFQLLDFISLIGSTIGGFGIKKPFLCNGANLCYSKKAFQKVNGFEGNNNISSGDDIFMLEKMVAEFPNNVHFLKSYEALVITKPQPNFKELFSQRIRWASKTSSYNNWFGKFVGISVLFMNLLILYLLVAMLFKTEYLIFFIPVFSIKFIIDFIIIYKMLLFTKQTENILFYPIIVFFYSFFNVFVVLFTYARKKYTWKERYFNT